MINALRQKIYSLEKYGAYYDFFMAFLAVAIVIVLILDVEMLMSSEQKTIAHRFDLLVWFFFAVDYIVRLLISTSRWKFVRNNIIDLIALLPFSIIFQGLRATRFLRLIYMFRAFAYLNRAYSRICRLLKTNDFDHVLWFTFCTIFLGAISISYIDDMNIGDAFWWSFVTTTTVGYGDIAPQSMGGRIVAVFLMIVGIGFLSTLTGTIATFFIKNANKSSFKDAQLEQVVTQLHHFSDLTEDDIDDIHAVLIALKQNEKNKKRK